jgi:hypothetical protein
VSSLALGGQIELRRIDGGQKIAIVFERHPSVSA